MIFYIVPTIDQTGQYYEIEKWERRGFLQKYCFDGLLDGNGEVDCVAQDLGLECPEKFNSVEKAVSFIRKHYGEKAVIGKWRPK